MSRVPIYKEGGGSVSRARARWPSVLKPKVPNRSRPLAKIL